MPVVSNGSDECLGAVQGQILFVTPEVPVAEQIPLWGSPSEIRSHGQCHDLYLESVGKKVNPKIENKATYFRFLKFVRMKDVLNLAVAYSEKCFP